MKAMMTALIVGVLVAPLPAIAHHAFAAEFDSNKTVTVQGSVFKLEWTNPDSRRVCNDLCIGSRRACATNPIPQAHRTAQSLSTGRGMAGASEKHERRPVGRSDPRTR